MQALFTRIRGLGISLLLACGFVFAQPVPQQQPPPEPFEPGAQTSAALATAAPAPVDPKKFVVGPEDILMVRVWREPEHSGLVTVRPDGMITLPLIGELKAGGLTPEKLNLEVKQALSKYINDPDVIVSVQAVRSQRYFISGEVIRPGAYPMVVTTNVLQALTLAGGFRDFANKKKIIIMRGDKRLRFNYNDVIKGKNPEQNINLENGDYIIVP